MVRMLRLTGKRLILLLFILGISTHALSVPVGEETHSLASSIAMIQQASSDAEGSSDWVLFLGRFHPLLVHLPIGFLLLAFLLEFCTLFERFKQLDAAVPFALLLGALSAIFAGVTGYLLSSDGGYGESLLSTHMWLGILVAILSLSAFVLKIQFVDRPAVKNLYRSILVLMLGALMVAGHYGGSLTHGSDYLTRYMPEPLRSVAGLPPKEERGIKPIANIDSALVFKDIIHPILDTRCTNCHNSEKKKGELLLTTFGELMQGGENGAIVEAGKSGESEMYKRLVLPESDDDHMPPEGKLQLTNDQIDLIAWWIDQGAPAGNMVSELQVPEDISEALLKLTDEGKSFLAKTEVPEADDEIIENVTKQGYSVSAITRENNFLQVRFSESADTLKSRDMELLIPLAQQITWLDLSGTGIVDSNLTALSEFKNLTRLNLEQTGIGDSTLKRVSSLEYLEYLNVYATGIGDEGLAYLEGNKNLKSLYVWQTDVSNEAVEQLEKKLPDLYINTGWENENRAQQQKSEKESDDVSGKSE